MSEQFMDPIDIGAGDEDEDAKRLEARRTFLLAQNAGDPREAAAQAFQQTALPNDVARATAAQNTAFASPAPPGPIVGGVSPATMLPTLITNPVTKRESITTTSYTKETPDEKRLRQEQDAIRKRSYEVAQKQLAAKVGQAYAQLDADKLMELEREKRAQIAGKAEFDGAEAFKQGKAQYESEKEKLKGMGYQGFWAKGPNGGNGNRALAALAIALGGIGDALNAKAGQRTNFGAEVMQQIDNAVERDWKQHQARLAMQERALERSGVNVQRLEDRMDRAKAAHHAAAYELVEAQGRRLLAVKGVDAAEADGNAIIQALQERHKGEDLQYQESLRKRVQSQVEQVTLTGGVGGAGGKAPTEGQGKMALLAEQMIGELKVLEGEAPLSDKALSMMQTNQSRVEAADKSAASGILNSVGVGLAREVGLVPKSKYKGLNEREQKVANAWDNVLEKYTRLLTGAGMPLDEAKRMAVQDAPHADDSAELKAQKLQRMREAAAQMMSLAGPAAAQVQRATAGVAPSAQPTGSAPQGVPPGARRYRTADGKTGWLAGEDFYPD